MPKDEERIRDAGWIPVRRSNGFWIKPGDGRILSTAAVLKLLDEETKQ